MRLVLALVLVVSLPVACVTESTGPTPAADAERVQAQLDLARGYMEENDFGQARRPLNRALEIDPRNVEAHVLLGVVNQAEGDQDLAEANFRSALRVSPDDPQALNNYASFLYGQGRYDEAVKPLRRLVQNPSYPARSQAYENLGIAELRIGERDRAREAFRRALSLNFRQPRSSLELAMLAFEDGEYPQAQRFYDDFRGLARQNARSLCLGLRLGRALGNADQVASYQLALRNLYADSPDAQRCVEAP